MTKDEAQASLLLRLVEETDETGVDLIIRKLQMLENIST